MTKESKLALIIGFVLVLVVGVLVSDHFSQASSMTLDTMDQPDAIEHAPIAQLGERERAAISSAIPERNSPIAQQQTPELTPDQQEPMVISQKSIIEQAIDEARRIAQDTDLPAAAEPIRTQPQPVDRPLPSRSYQSYTVVKDDSLIGIARRLLGDGDRWREIESLNADVLGPDLVLQIGMTLRLPEDARTPRQSLRSSDQGTPTRSYTVVAGDTLGEISLKLLGTSKRMNEIVELNGLESPDQIFVGMTLKIPAR